jgi:hypothetical protein
MYVNGRFTNYSLSLSLGLGLGLGLFVFVIFVYSFGHPARKGFLQSIDFLSDESLDHLY